MADSRQLEIGVPIFALVGMPAPVMKILWSWRCKAEVLMLDLKNFGASRRFAIQEWMVTRENEC
jgi:hypothetical protein